MTQRITTSIAAAILCVAGCDIVTIDAPFGVPVDDAKQMAISGRWIDDDGEVVEIRRTKEGQLVYGWLEWDGKTQHFIAKTDYLDVRHVGEVDYMFMKIDDQYMFGRISSVSETEMRIHSPSPDAFRRSVDNGRLSGRVHIIDKDHFHVQLDSDSELTVAVFAEAKLGDLYSDDGMRSFRRIKSFKSVR